jgi:hypothetical protein
MLVCNELDAKRRTRLRKVLEEYLPSKVLENIRVSAHDGTKWHRCVLVWEEFIAYAATLVVLLSFGLHFLPILPMTFAF